MSNARKPFARVRAVFRALTLSLKDPALYAAVDGTAVPIDGARPVTTGAVMSLSAAWACTRLIAETIATLPLSIYENGKAGKRVASEHPLQLVVHDQANPDATAAVFWESMVSAMLLRGNAYAEKLMSGDRIVGLQFLHPDCMTIRIASNGAREVQFKDPRTGKVRIIPWARVWHLPGYSQNGRTGVSVIAQGAAVFASAIAVQDAARLTFQRGLHQTSALKLPGTLREDQRDDAREALHKLSGALNAGRGVVLEGGTDIVTVGIKPVDAQMIEAQGFSVEEVCRWFRVPPFMVGHSEKSTSWGTGIESQMQAFITFTLAPWLRRIEQGIAKDLLPAGGRYYAKHSVEGLLRADSAARAAFYSAMVNNGIYTRDECRVLEDREPMGGNAAVLTVQTALAPLDTLGQTSDSESARAALKAWLREDAPPPQN